MNPEKEIILGMELDVWRHESCVAEVATGDTWATLYLIVSEQPGKGHATELLKQIKAFYEDQGLEFTSSIALNQRMSGILGKLKIKEWRDEKIQRTQEPEELT